MVVEAHGFMIFTAMVLLSHTTAPSIALITTSNENTDSALRTDMSLELIENSVRDSLHILVVEYDSTMQVVLHALMMTDGLGI